MKSIFKIIVLLLIFASCDSDEAQTIDAIFDPDVKIEKVAELSSELNEISGLIFFNNKLVAINDSGGEAVLYELNPNTGQILRKVNVLNAENKDWEDLSQDETHIYIADLGDNGLDRKEYFIYKILKSDFLTNENVVAEKINLNYTNGDGVHININAEALTQINESLVVFSKEKSELTNVYETSKQIGSFEIVNEEVYNIEGEITSATYDSFSNKIILTGYSGFKPFIVKLTNFSNGKYFNGNVDRDIIILPGSIQVESIAFAKEKTYYLASERVSGFSASLYKMKL